MVDDETINLEVAHSLLEESELIAHKGWQTFSYVLNAADENTELRLISRGPTSNASDGSFLEGITVSTVPEPATIGLMLAGLGMIGFTTRQQRQK